MRRWISQRKEHTEISPQTEKEMDTGQEDDGVGVGSKEEKEMDIADEDLRIVASILEMHTRELKGWFVESQVFRESLCRLVW